MTNELHQALNINPLKVAFPEHQVLGVAQFFLLSTDLSYTEENWRPHLALLPWPGWAQPRSRPPLLAGPAFLRFQAPWWPRILALWWLREMARSSILRRLFLLLGRDQHSSQLSASHVETRSPRCDGCLWEYLQRCTVWQSFLEQFALQLLSNTSFLWSSQNTAY